MATAEPGSVNDALVQIGAINRYQLFMLFITSLFYILNATQSLVIVFTEAKMGYRYVLIDFLGFDIGMYC